MYIMIYWLDKGEVELVETNGMWIGLLDEIGEFNSVDQLTMKTGDIMLLYTDGITEAIDKQDEFYSEKKLIIVLKEFGEMSTKDVKNGILNSV